VHIGMVGLGRMGGNMLIRLRRAGIDVTGYDRSSPTRDVTSLEELVGTLPTPRIVWVMVPHGAPTQSVVDSLGELLEPDDLVIEGGNSRATSRTRPSSPRRASATWTAACPAASGAWTTGTA